MSKFSPSLVAIVLGLGLLVYSFVAPRFQNTDSIWNEQQYASFEKARQERMNAQGHASELSHGSHLEHTDSPPDPTQLESTRRAFEAQQQQLEAARDKVKKRNRLLLITAIIVTAGGVIANRVGY